MCVLWVDKTCHAMHGEAKRTAITSLCFSMWSGNRTRVFRLGGKHLHLPSQRHTKIYLVFTVLDLKPTEYCEVQQVT